MGAAVNKKTVTKPFSNEEQVVRVVYDFAQDGGALGALELLEADGDLLITGFHAVVKTACTSGGSAVVEVGDAGDDDIYMTSGAVAGLTANAVIQPTIVDGTPPVLVCPRKLADGGKISMTIGTAALTAGKIEFTFKVMRL